MEIMNTRRMMAIGLAGLLALSAQSCLKSYVEYFDDSSASRLSTYLSDLDAMLGGEQYGWRMEYFVGNEDGDFGGINVALKFDNEKGEVTAEGRGGDYQFFIIGYDKENKVVNLKGKRNGKFCNLYPLSQPIADYNAKMFEINRNFYVSTFDGEIGGQKVTGDIDVRNHQFTAYEMESYGTDKDGKPLYDIANTITVPYILTEKGLSFYEPLKVFGTEIESMDFNFNLAQSDTTFRSASGVTFKGHIPADWLPYEFFAGTYSLMYGTTFGTGITINGIELIPEEPGVNFRVKGMSSQFDLLMDYNIRTGRIELRYQAVLRPGLDEVVIDNDQYIVILLPWALGPDSGGLWMNPDLGMAAKWNGDRENPSFTWVDNGGSKRFSTTSFLLYYYDTDETADSPYYDSAESYSFTGGNYQLPYLRTFRKTK